LNNPVQSGSRQLFVEAKHIMRLLEECLIDDDLTESWKAF